MPAVDGEPSINELARGQARIEAAVTSLTESMNFLKDSLGQKYVPREELASTFSSIRDHQQQQDSRLTGLESGRDVDRTALESRVQLVEERHRSDRFNAKMFALTAMGAVVALAGIVIAHWK